MGKLGALKVVKLDICCHTFYRNCLRELVNGISTFSNKCPKCREQICEPRAKKPVFTEVAEEQEFDVEVVDGGGIGEELVVEDVPVEVLDETEAARGETRR